MSESYQMKVEVFCPSEAVSTPFHIIINATEHSDAGIGDL
jgi:hypothetical protein